MKHLLVMAKAPVAGRVKTRLCPPCSPEEAAAVAAAALADTLEAVAGCAADRKIVALAGRPGPSLRAHLESAGVEVIAQRGATFADRLAHAWSDAGPIGVQIGMDTPQVTTAELDDLLTLLPDRPEPVAVLGHAPDGGWWALGLAGADPSVAFAGIPMSTPVTGRLQEERLATLGLRVVHAPVRRDIDTIEDLLAVAATMAPRSHTRALVDTLTLDEQVA